MRLLMNHSVRIIRIFLYLLNQNCHFWIMLQNGCGSLHCIFLFVNSLVCNYFQSFYQINVFIVYIYEKKRQ